MASQLIVSRKNAKNFYGSKIKILSPAKINLYLNILKRYPSGFHKIESIVERISLFDEITVSAIKQKEIKFFCNKRNLVNKKNLCVRVASLLQSKFKINHGFEVNLFKKIPVGSGMGGGSSNAAAMILAIDDLCNLRLTSKEMYKIGEDIGSDVNFFLAETRFALISGRGERVLPIKGKTLKHTIIWPGISLSTKEVYASSRVKLTKFLNNVNMIQYALKRGDLNVLKHNIFNALEYSALSLCRKLSATKIRLLDKNIFARVTGSGSALYTVSSVSLYKKVRNILPANYFIYDVQTF